jgi:hypothetical protein
MNTKEVVDTVKKPLDTGDSVRHLYCPSHGLTPESLAYCGARRNRPSTGITRSVREAASLGFCVVCVDSAKHGISACLECKAAR